MERDLGMEIVSPEDILEQKREIIDLVYHSGKEAHLSSAMSVLEIINILLREKMFLKSGDVSAPGSDKLVLSKGHAALALYVVYLKMGILSKQELQTYQEYNSRLGVHPDRHKVPGVEVSTGSLGHGLPVATGIAYGWRLQNKKNKVYVVVGDSELCEGTNWEALLVASELKLDNLVCVVDNNHTSENLDRIAERFHSFGWETCEANGHNLNDLRAAFRDNVSKPYAVIADTIKGHGFALMEQEPQEWHHKRISESEYAQFWRELNESQRSVT